MKNNRVSVAVAVLLGIVVAVTFAERARTDAKADAKAQLMDADRAFAKAAGERGLEGWMSFMADDAVRISPLGGKAHVGKAAVRTLDANLFADSNKRLLWEPTDGGAFADGTHGYTTGTSKMVSKAADGGEEVHWKGVYVTCWRKTAAGQWKVILDTGAAAPNDP